jgi:hypothetical protein
MKQIIPNLRKNASEKVRSRQTLPQKEPVRYRGQTPSQKRLTLETLRVRPIMESMALIPIAAMLTDTYRLGHRPEGQ